ncbi:MAG: PilZ domain-containing protein [Deltaproteobacteria bacterium]|nr:PilZ domain-containing protein [Deltaproteobacteria bacterium]
MRRYGVQLLVREPVHAEVWRLLVQRALYQGDERRRDPRLAVGSEIALSYKSAPPESAGAARRAILIDISNRGCRLAETRPFTVGTVLSVAIPGTGPEPETLELEGRTVRVSTVRGSANEMFHSAALIFEPEPDERSRSRLTTILNSWARGAGTVASTPCGVAPLPPCESSQIPGLTLDDETDPAIPAGVAVDLCVGSAGPIASPTPAPSSSPSSSPAPSPAAADDHSERRTRPRADFQHEIQTVGDSHTRVLMGRDLSAGGMRVETLPWLEVGDQLRLALYGLAEAGPTIVSACVIRDDGEAGLALRFDGLAGEEAERLEKLVASLPGIESLEGCEADAMGTIISEVLPED